MYYSSLDVQIFYFFEYYVKNFTISILGTLTTNKSGKMMNPWAVNNLNEFLYYCCPECEEKVKSLETFLQHALNKHDLAKEILPNIIVKEEFDEQYNDDYDTVSEII